MLAFGAEARGLAAGEDLPSRSASTPRSCSARGPRSPSNRSAACRAIAERLDDPLFGLALVETLPFGAGDLLDYLLRNCATAGESWMLLSKFAPLINDADGIRLDRCRVTGRAPAVADHQ